MPFFPSRTAADAAVRNLAASASREPLPHRRTVVRDVAWLVAGFIGLCLWDAAGLDLPLSRLFADGSGFAWRDHWLFEGVLHNGTRWLAWAVCLVLAVNVARALPFARDVARADRAWWLATTLACVLLVPLLKRTSHTSCPWSLGEFGGTAAYVSHWAVGVADGGEGRCFPAGHATAAFCFLAGHFALRESAPAAS